MERVSLPVSSQQLRVVDAQGTAVPSDTLPVPASAALNGSEAAPYQLSFLAEVAAMGFSTYFLTSSVATATHRALDEVHQAQAAPTPYKCGQGTGFNVTNGRVALSFDGACVLQSYSINGTTTAFSHGAGFYYGWQTSSDEVLDCRGFNSGAYLFRPQNQTSVSLTPVSASYSVTGQAVTEVYLTYGDWFTEVVRLVKGSDVVEFQFTVGPVPIEDGKGKEVILTYTAPAWADPQSTPVIYTDSNGKDWQRRERDHRDTWTLNSTEPVSSTPSPLSHRPPLVLSMLIHRCICVSSVCAVVGGEQLLPAQRCRVPQLVDARLLLAGDGPQSGHRIFEGRADGDHGPQKAPV